MAEISATSFPSSSSSALALCNSLNGNLRSQNVACLRTTSLFQELSVKRSQLSGNAVATGHVTRTRACKSQGVTGEKIEKAPQTIITKVPSLEQQEQMDRDAETHKANLNLLRMVLERCRFSCDGIETLCRLCLNDLTLDNEGVDLIIRSAFADHVRRNPDANPNAKVNLSLHSMKYGIGMLKDCLDEWKLSDNYLKEDTATEKRFMERLSSDVIPPGDIGVAFKDIGALQNVKDTLKELVIVPFQRPELFSKGKLTQFSKGILLYGPPGTGKTMLANAVAMEAGANFINFPMPMLASKWFGQAEKYVKAVFSLASKLYPCVIFVDEVDKMLGERENPGEDEATLKMMKIVFKKYLDDLLTKEKERVIVIAATNRPFDLDEALISRFSRRLMVGLPDAPSRAKILRVILAEEDMSNDIDIDEVASIADGYSGRDLKNLCAIAAHHPVKELLRKEKNEQDAALADGKSPPPLLGTSDIRGLNMQDFKHALDQVNPSKLSVYVHMIKLQEWNEFYGEGGSRKRKAYNYLT